MQNSPETSELIHNENNGENASAADLHLMDNTEREKALKKKLWTTKPVIDKCLVRSALHKLSQLRESVAQLNSYRFYSASLLFIYEGKSFSAKSKLNCQDETGNSSRRWFHGEVNVRLIDFAHYCCGDESVHPGPDAGILYGLDNLIKLLGQFLQ